MDILKSYYIIIYAYAIFLGFIYSLSYWSVFNVDILMYINVLDLIKFSLKPLFYAIIPLIAALFVVEFIFFNEKDDESPSVNDNLLKILRPYITGLALIIFLFLLYFYIQGYILKAFYMGLCISIPLYLYIKNIDKAKLIIKNESIRSILVYVLLMLPWFAYDIGAAYGKDRLSCKQCHAAINYDGSNMYGEYIGHINSYFFIRKIEEDSIYIIYNPEITKINKDTYIFYM